MCNIVLQADPDPEDYQMVVVHPTPAPAARRGPQTPSNVPAPQTEYSLKLGHIRPQSPPPPPQAQRRKPDRMLRSSIPVPVGMRRHAGLVFQLNPSCFLFFLLHK